MHRHLVTGEVVVDEKAALHIGGESLHQGTAHAHGHPPNHLAARRDRVENAPCVTHRQHTAHADFASMGVYGYFNKVRGEGADLQRVFEVAKVDGVFCDQLFAISHLRKRYLRGACDHPALFKPRRVHTKALGNLLLYLQAGRVNTGGGAGSTKLPPGTRRDRVVAVAQPYLHVL